MAFVTPVVEHWLEREIAQWDHPMKDRSDDPLRHEQTLLPWSYISLHEMGRKEMLYLMIISTPWMLSFLSLGKRFRSMVRALADGARGSWIDPSWCTHWAISCLTKAMVCAILFSEMMHIKEGRKKEMFDLTTHSFICAIRISHTMAFVNPIMEHWLEWEIAK